MIPIRGDLDANHVRLIDILRRVAEHRPDVVVTTECFLDGYVFTESWVTKENIIEYAIDLRGSIYTDERNLHMLETRSYESEIFIVFTHPSQALITGPKGQIICNEVSEEKTYTVNEIDLSEVDAVRSGEFSHLKDRRPDLYRL